MERVSKRRAKLRAKRTTWSTLRKEWEKLLWTPASSDDPKDTVNSTGDPPTKAEGDVEEKVLQNWVHPEQLRQVDFLLELSTILEHVLSERIRLYAQERQLVQEALDRITEQVNRRAREGASAGETKTYGLRDVQGIFLKAHLAQIELSLADGQKREAEQDEDATPVSDPMDELAPRLSHPDDIIDGDREELTRSVKESLGLFQANQKISGEISKGVEHLTLAKRAFRSTRKSARGLEQQIAVEVLKQRDLKLRDALNHMWVTPDEIQSLNKMVARSRSLRKKNKEVLQEKLSKLGQHRSALLNAGGGSRQETRILDLKELVLAEGVHLENIKLGRDEFVLDLATVLNTMIRGRRPGSRFMQTHDTWLNPARVQQRLVHLERRCDGWRREQNTLQHRPDPALSEGQRKGLLSSYERLQDRCMRLQWVLATRSRLAKIAQHHLRQVSKVEHSVFWYLLRGFFSLFFAVIAFLCSRWLGRLTRRVALPAVESLSNLKLGGLNIGKKVAGGLSARAHRNIAVLVYFLGVLSIWTSAALLCLTLVWSIPIDTQSLILWLRHPVISIGTTPVSLWMLLRLLIWIAASIWVAGWVQRFTSNHFLQYFDMDRGIRDTLGVVFRYVTLLIGLILALTSVGIASDQLTVVFGLLSIGIGFGLRDIVSNYLSGLFLLFTRPIRKGDYVQSDGLFGVVQDIRAGSTTVQTRDAVSVIIPNSEFINGRVVNWTHGDNESVRAQVCVGVAYDSDLEHVKGVLLDIVAGEPNALERPAPRVDIVSLGTNSIDISLHFWTKEIFTMPRLKSELYSKIISRFGEEKISIPFPQRQIHQGAPPPTSRKD